jgi:hypothetical protein
MDQYLGTWTAEGVKGGLIGFYREIAGVGLVFPRGDRPIAVEFPGYPVVRLRPIEGLEFVGAWTPALVTAGLARFTMRSRASDWCSRGGNGRSRSGTPGTLLSRFGRSRGSSS